MFKNISFYIGLAFSILLGVIFFLVGKTDRLERVINTAKAKDKVKEVDLIASEAEKNAMDKERSLRTRINDYFKRKSS